MGPMTGTSEEEPADGDLSGGVRDMSGDDAALAFALKSLPPARVSEAFRDKLVRDFEHWARARSERPWAAVRARLAAARETLWPGASSWPLALAFSLSFVVGLTAGLALLEPPDRHESNEPSLIALFDSPEGIDLRESGGG